jgi:hypothetical protein
LLISVALVATLLLGYGVSGCSSPPTTTGEPTTAANPGQDVRDQLAGHAAAAKDRRYVATYSLAKEGRADRTVTVAVAADGSWVVAVPAGLLGGLVNAAIFKSRDGLFQCSLGPAGGAPAWLDPALTAPGCVKVSRLRAGADPDVQHVFTDWIDPMIDRAAAISVATAKLLPGATGSCYSIEANSAALASPVDPGIYCYDTTGTLTAARSAFGTLTLVGTPAAAPPSVAMPAPVVDRAPLGLAAPEPPPSPTPSASATPRG